MNSQDFDEQALQMEEIAKIASEKPELLLDYISTPVFTGLISILEKNTTELEPASEAQIEARKKIIINELVKREASAKNMDIKNIDVPYELSEEEIELAMALAPMEQAERNKEYALYTVAILAKAYGEEVKEKYEENVPITDLPGITNIVNVLKNEKNPGVKVAAIDALIYCRKPEYNDEIKSILLMATNDRNQMVAESARGGLMTLEALDD